MTARGKILIIKIKGDHLDNDESKAKDKDWGYQLDNFAGPMYRYFIVFQRKRWIDPERTLIIVL